MGVGYLATSKLHSDIPVVIALLLALLVSGQSILIFLNILTKRDEGFQNRPSLYSKSSDPLMPDIPDVDVIGKNNEGVQSMPVECVGDSKKAFECGPKATQPTSANPFMNVLIDELKYSYQNWLYRIPFKTCKEGNSAACLPGTDGGALPWLNEDNTFTVDGSSVTGPGSSPRDVAAGKRIAALESAVVNRYPSPYVGSDSGLDKAVAALGR